MPGDGEWDVLIAEGAVKANGGWTVLLADVTDALTVHIGVKNLGKLNIENAREIDERGNAGGLLAGFDFGQKALSDACAAR